MSAVLDHHGAHARTTMTTPITSPTGWRRWVFATNHKDIGTLYLLFSFTMLMIGGLLALGIRAELFQPGLQVVNPELFNQLTTMHGIIMVFGGHHAGFRRLLPNWMLPLQIGASDMAFARMNNFSFWLMVPAAIILGVFVLHARWRARRRLDAVRPADAADGGRRWMRPSSRCTSWARRPSWARSTSS
jgi:cytochrome c oxidase subunit 1